MENHLFLENALKLSRLLLVLVARRKLVAVALILTVSTTLALTLYMPKQYKATATLVLNYKEVDPVSGLTMSAQLMPRYMATQVDIMTNMAVATRVVDALGLANMSRFRREFKADRENASHVRTLIAESLLKKLTVLPARESSVLDITFQDRDPGLAAGVANAFASAYQQAAVKLKVEPMMRTSQYLSGQVEESLARLEKAQRDYSEFQKTHNILSTERGADADAARYSELSTQLVAVQGELTAVSARSWQAQGDAAAGSPDVLASPLIQNLKSELARAQVRLADVAERFRSAHPAYIAAEAEVRKWQLELDRQTALLGHTVYSSERTLRQREARLKAELSAQQERLLERNQARDALAILARRIESAQQVYTITSQRFAQARFESESKQADVSLLNSAEPPQKPFSPNLLLNLAAGIFLGFALGCGMAFLAERNDQRVRSIVDMTSGLDTPLLGVVGSGRSSIGRSEPAASLPFLSPLK